MQKKLTQFAAVAMLIVGAGSTPAFADAAKPGQSMTHMKSALGLTASLKSAGIVLYTQGGATSAVMGESIGSADGLIVFHIPITATKSGVEHLGSNIVFFNTLNNKQVQFRNPVIDLKAGVINAVIPQGSGQYMAVLSITNAKDLKPKVTDDAKTKLRTTSYKAASLSLAPGVAGALASLLGLPDGSFAEGLAFGSADVTLYSQIPAKKK